MLGGRCRCALGNGKRRHPGNGGGGAVGTANVAGAAGAAGAAARAGPRILVVDDDAQLVRAVRPTLTAHGYEPHDAPSGEAALELFARLRPDAVLLDLGLPGIDGLAVIGRIREHHETPIVVLSARGEERD